VLQPQYSPSRAASSNFWGGLILMEIFWVIMAVLSLRQMGYMILCLMGFAFTGTNINGYWKCRSWSAAKLPESQQASLNTGIPTPSMPTSLMQVRMLFTSMTFRARSVYNIRGCVAHRFRDPQRLCCILLVALDRSIIARQLQT
jgi:hypothetical protein